MFERTPPGLDKRVGIRDVGLREKPFEESRIDQFIDSAVEVLDTTVNEKSWFYINQSARSIEQEFGRSVWIERCGHFPCENATREVVNDGMKVCAVLFAKTIWTFVYETPALGIGMVYRLV